MYSVMSKFDRFSVVYTKSILKLRSDVQFRSTIVIPIANIIYLKNPKLNPSNPYSRIKHSFPTRLTTITVCVVTNYCKQLLLVVT